MGVFVIDDIRKVRKIPVSIRTGIPLSETDHMQRRPEGILIIVPVADNHLNRCLAIHGGVSRIDLLHVIQKQVDMIKCIEFIKCIDTGLVRIPVHGYGGIGIRSDPFDTIDCR